MQQAIDELIHGLSDPAILFGHFTYLLLIVSMLMRKMVWLRSIAVASGIAKIIYRAFMVVDPVSVLWETIFVLVNVGQLAVIWYYENHHAFTEDERYFMSTIPREVERRSIRKLLNLSSVRQVETGDTLITEGTPMTELMFIASGVATVEHEGTVVAACGPGDYLGEMSFLTGKPASATARASKPVRLIVFDQLKLKNALDGDPGVRRAMESSLNLNLVGKLFRANEHHTVVETG